MLRFSMIDINKSLQLSKTKGVEEKLKLVNKLKIITCDREMLQQEGVGGEKKEEAAGEAGAAQH